MENLIVKFQLIISKLLLKIHAQGSLSISKLNGPVKIIRLQAKFFLYNLYNKIYNKSFLTKILIFLPFYLNSQAPVTPKLYFFGVFRLSRLSVNNDSKTVKNIPHKSSIADFEKYSLLCQAPVEPTKRVRKF